MEAQVCSAEGQAWIINGRFLTQRVTGVQRYAREIVAALDKLLQNDDRSIMMQLMLPSKAKAPTLPTSRISICRTNVGTGHVWDQFILPLYAGAGMLSLGNFGPVISRNHIVCIHDANTFIFPESYSRSFGLFYRTLLPVVGKRAQRVATVSQYSADMLVKYGICQREKIFIAPNGHEHVLRWDARQANLPLLGALKRPFILLLGSTAKHKNVDMILRQAQAFDEAGIDVVVVGGSSSIFARSDLMAEHANVHHIGFVGDNELAALYENAMCLVFPSKTEGFGIPPLEAMTKGCPVISSNATSLVEVGGDAVIYVDPDDSDRWRDAIVGLSRNEGLRATLSARGRQRVTLFSWERSAELYLDEIVQLRQARQLTD
jgi:glycosyltransferase involved in cell wall biosynthesis